MCSLQAEAAIVAQQEGREDAEAALDAAVERLTAAEGRANEVSLMALICLMSSARS
jgi:hypothetical protein